MPFILDRRRFLGAFSVAGFASQSVLAANAPANWALLSDPHINANLNTPGWNGENIYTNVARSVSQVAAASPQICVVPGDLSHVTGETADYNAFRQLFSPISSRTPILMAVGNHDNRTNLQRAFPTSPAVNQKVSGRYVLVLDYDDWRVIVLDSLLAVNEPEGLVGSTQRSWLQKFLARDRKRTFIFVHHDPGETDISMADGAQLLSIVKPATHVKALFFGHQHAYQVSSTNGLYLVQLPSAAYNFDPAQPIGWVQMALASSGAQLTLRVNSGNFSPQGSVTNLVWR